MTSTSKKVTTSTLAAESKNSVKRFVPEDGESLRHIVKIIKQPIPKDCEKKGPGVILRSVDLSDGIVITRIGDEGTKPLFEREGIKVNAVANPESTAVVKFQYKKEPSPSRRHQSDAKQRFHSLRTGIDKFKTKSMQEEPCGSKSSSTIVRYDNKRKDFKPKVNTNVPYFSDPIRERDRIKRLYGSSSRRRSRSRTPENSRRGNSARTHRLDYSPRSRRSTSRNRHRSHSPYRVSGRDDRDKRSRRKSRTRSPKYDRSSHKSSGRSSREMKQESNDHENIREESNQVMPPGPYIPVPVAVTDYSYAFPPWHGPPAIWGPPLHRPPPSHYGHYHPIVPMMPMRPPHIGYGPTPAMSYAPISAPAYRPRPPNRYPHPRQSADTYHPRYKKPSS